VHFPSVAATATTPHKRDKRTIIYPLGKKKSNMNVNKDYESQLPGQGRAVASAFGMNMGSDTPEDLPPMRAVSLGTQPATLQFSTASGAGGQKLRSEGKFDRFNKISILESKNCDETRGGVRREWKECSWKVSNLSEVPLGFPLERTRREIDNVSVTEVVERITKCLRLLSIEAEFDGENAKAKCKTSDMVGFRIRLFAGEAKAQEPIVVEIQRRSGSPQCFMSVCKKILDAAEGVEIQPETIPSRKKMASCIMKTPASDMKCLQNVNKQDPLVEVNVGINKSLEMLRSKKKDVNLLGLENLCFMTDPLKTRPDMAIISCKAVIVGQYCSEIRHEIETMLQKDAFLSEEFGVDPCKELFDKCHHLAIVLLSNVLALTSQDGCLADAVQKQSWFSEFLIPSLLGEVKSFEVSSNNAYEAACGLTSLATCSDVARKVMMENSAVDSLQSANEFAIYNHDLLASETRRSLELLGHSI